MKDWESVGTNVIVREIADYNASRKKRSLELCDLEHSRAKALAGSYLPTCAAYSSILDSALSIRHKYIYRP